MAKRGIGFYLRFGLDSMRKNKRYYLPYALTCLLMQTMFFIVASLVDNPGLQQIRGGTTLAGFLYLGLWVIGIFSLLFLTFTHGFLMKQRTSEFGLYHVLGMEKRHVGRIVTTETLVLGGGVTVASLALGVLLNKLALAALLRLAGESIPLGFHISIDAMGKTALVYGVIYLLLLVVALVRLRRVNAINLLRSGQVGEREPKARWILALLGVVLLGAGYAISVLTTNVMAAIFLFLVAVVLVILGTYLLFMAGSIALLKLMKGNKKYYYQTKHFINVSGMLYRMKQNAASLASICILSTMVLVTISGTTSLFLGSINALQYRYPRQMQTQVTLVGDIDQTPLLLDAANASIQQTLANSGVEPKNTAAYSRMGFYAKPQGSSYTYVDEQSQGVVHMMFLAQESYNALALEPVALEPGQALIYRSNGSQHPGKTLEVGGETFQLKGQISDDAAKTLFSDNGVIQVVGVVVPQQEQLDLLYEKLYAPQGSWGITREYYTNFDTDLEGEASYELASKLRRALSDSKDGIEIPDEAYIGVGAMNREDSSSSNLATYGGLFFIGVFLATLFALVTILMIYYKQISEGLQDARRFSIMKRVGLSKHEIKGSIRSQVMTVFFAPLLAAGVHCLFAMPIINRILAVLSMTNTNGFMLCMGISFGVFTLFYVLVYNLTARTYFKIVNQ